MSGRTAQLPFVADGVADGKFREGDSHKEHKEHKGYCGCIDGAMGMDCLRYLGDPFDLWPRMGCLLLYHDCRSRMRAKLADRLRCQVR